MVKNAKKKNILVKMVRSKKDFPAPHTADVHPDEVNNYQAGGWKKSDKED